MIRAAFTAGALVAGLVVIVRGWRPAPRPLTALAADLLRERADLSTGDQLRSGWRRVATRLAGKPSPRRLADLAVANRTAEHHGVAKTGGALVAGALATGGLTAAAMAGVASPTGASGLMLVVIVAGGFLYPDVALRSKAKSARREWNRALASYLDIVSICLAGGAGVEEAVMDAAATGTGPQLGQLAAALRRAQLRRHSLWLELEQLGREADVSSLRELAASMELASESGSRIRETLAAKATALRVKHLTETEAEAQRASETIGIAPALMAIAAVLLVGYPAVVSFLAS